MNADHDAEALADGRVEPRLPEELVAIMNDNAVAKQLIEALPEERIQAARHSVEAGSGRLDRARRAVDVVREAIKHDPD